ncbi:phosphopyruvate hydratase [Candidatus Parcubacteria bacterium]|nr:MAG: phosphopyruvate hydratase [Candidatus Parcubacteria bacterium]
MTISGLDVREIPDSRGEPTVEVILRGGGGEFFAQVPSGKSRGMNEAAVVSPERAKKVLREEVLPGMAKKDYPTLAALDEALIALDGTPSKTKIGGNLILGVSVAFSRALASEKSVEPWEVLKEEFFPRAEAPPPLIFSNLINGGAHAKNNLDIQEYMVVAGSEGGMEAAIQKLARFYEALGEELRTAGEGRRDVPLGDEGGYAPDLEDNAAPIALLDALIRREGLEKEFRLGLDAAASSFYKDGAYRFEGKKLSSSELLETYRRYFGMSELLYSVEDPFAETDYDGFGKFHSEFSGKLSVGDDLTVTNETLIRKFAGGGMINGVIIKPNQIGTLTETCRAIKAAHELGVKTIVSHRSGETMDPFIIYVARASGAYGVKIGAPKQKERLAKFEELVRLYG